MMIKICIYIYIVREREREFLEDRFNMFASVRKGRAPPRPGCKLKKPTGLPMLSLVPL